MMSKRKISTILILSGIGLALFLGISDVTDNSFFNSCSDSCKAVHQSSFGTLFGIPIGFVAAGIFFFVLYLHLYGKPIPVLYILAAMTGAEAYLTILQVLHLEAICTFCIGFFIILSILFLLFLVKKHAQSSAVAVLFVFFVAHFITFPPVISIKPSLVRKIDRPQIQVFASPSCEHCEDAITNLEKICTTSNIDLVLRPVGLSAYDRQESIGWVCNALFDNDNAASRCLAEKVVYQNERKAKAINEGQLSVPIIILKNKSGEQTYKGWTPSVKKAIENQLLAYQSMNWRSLEDFSGSFQNTRETDDTFCSENSDSSCSSQ
ncbi:MAG: hypothetical protein GY874_06495 [Desulfobacteraceae bacterium]|nr:hypothetical protein [Desulfobacteraceae bacterium]